MRFMKHQAMQQSGTNSSKQCNNVNDNGITYYFVKEGYSSHEFYGLNNVSGIAQIVGVMTRRKRSAQFEQGDLSWQIFFIVLRDDIECQSGIQSHLVFYFHPNILVSPFTIYRISSERMKVGLRLYSITSYTLICGDSRCHLIGLRRTRRSLHANNLNTYLISCISL